MRINQSFFGVYHGLSQHFVRPSVDGPVHGLSSFSIEMARYPSSFRQLWVDGTLLGGYAVYHSTLGHFWENDFQWYTPSSNTSMFFFSSIVPRWSSPGDRERTQEEPQKRWWKHPNLGASTSSTLLFGFLMSPPPHRGKKRNSNQRNNWFV